jgi:hypothetical protein
MASTAYVGLVNDSYLIAFTKELNTLHICPFSKYESVCFLPLLTCTTLVHSQIDPSVTGQQDPSMHYFGRESEEAKTRLLEPL